MTYVCCKEVLCNFQCMCILQEQYKCHHSNKQVDIQLHVSGGYSIHGWRHLLSTHFPACSTYLLQYYANYFSLTFITSFTTVARCTKTVSRSYAVTTIQAAIWWVTFSFITAFAMPVAITDAGVITAAVTMETFTVNAFPCSQEYYNMIIATVFITILCQVRDIMMLHVVR